MGEQIKGPAKELPEQEAKKKKTVGEKRAEHVDRIQRTIIASILGIVVGYTSFRLTADLVTGILLMLLGIIMQRYIFFFIRRNIASLTTKDWLFQGFMTFSFWFITWTLFLTP